jgi:uncharacterized membrane protein
MEPQQFLELALRWLHMFGAAGLLGGMLFMRFGLWSSLAGLEAEERGRIFGAAARKFAPWVGILAACVLISGIYNFVTIVQRNSFPGGAYHALGGLKLIFGVAVIGIFSVICGRTASAEKLRKDAPKWLGVCLILTVALVMMGGLMRSAERKPKAAVDTAEKP